MESASESSSTETRDSFQILLVHEFSSHWNVTSIPYECSYRWKFQARDAFLRRW